MEIVSGWQLVLALVQGGAPVAPPCTPVPVPVPVLVMVRDAATGASLPNAELLDTTSLRVHGRSDRNGLIRLRLDRSPTCYRVRQIGYLPAGFSSSAVPAPNDTLVVVLDRAAFALEELTVLSGSGCPGSSPGSGGTAAWLLDQVQLAASTYEGFVEAWPFEVRLERKTSTRRRMGGYALREARERVQGKRWREEYKPGSVVKRDRLGFSVPIFFVTLLGNQTFLENHCFRYDSLGTVDGGGAPFRILSFTPVPSLEKVDWAGRILLDPESGILRQIRFELVNLAGFRSLARFEGSTTFREVSPFVVIPDSTLAWWWRTEERARERNSLPDVLQQLKVTELKFRDDKRPPALPSG